MNRTCLSYIIVFLLFVFNSCQTDSDISNNPPPVNSGWTTQYTGITNNLKSIFFIDNYTGFAVGNSYPADSNKFILTTDGGLNWNRKPAPSRRNLSSVFFMNAFPLPCLT